jgi:leucyl aminopeptidase (aminopeptidase T)
MSKLGRAVRAVLEECLMVRPGENVLVLTDPAKRKIAEALVDGARSMDAEAMLVEIAERETHGSELPEPVAAAMVASDVLIAPTSKSVSHTEARRAATARGVRAATMPDITEDMLVRTMGADYAAIRVRSQAIARVLTEGRRVRVTTEKGTDLTLSIEGRDGISDDGDLSAAGAFGNLPAGEGFIAPREGHSHGRIVFDGSIATLGLLSAPITVDVEDGVATNLTGPRSDEFENLLQSYGRAAFAVAELGIGTNETATLTGKVLEDEKILGTIHVALGDNHTIGGMVAVPSHQDGIVLEPTVQVDGETLLDTGRLLV